MFSRGDIVLVPFLFTDDAGIKRRPAVVVSSAAYHQGRQEAVVLAVTSNTARILIGDHLLADWESAGLVHPSVCTGIIRTIKQSMIEKKLGSATAQDLSAIQQNLSLVLGLAG